MEIITIETLMIPIDEYATVSEEASLFEAVMALEKAQEKLDRVKYLYLHRGVLVYDKNEKIIGKISQLDVLRALEPKYEEVGDIRTISRAGFSSQFLKSMLENYSLCDRTFSDMCSRGGEIKVKDFMYTPAGGEYIDINDSLCEGLHQLVMGHHQSLLVTREEEIVGILRLVDVFMDVFQMMKTTCEI